MSQGRLIDCSNLWSITNRLKYRHNSNLIYTDIYSVWCLCRIQNDVENLGSSHWPIRVGKNHRLMIKVRMSQFRAKTKKNCEKSFGIKVKRIIIKSQWLLESGFHGIHSMPNKSGREIHEDLGQSVIVFFRLQLLDIYYLVAINQD